MEIVGDFKPLIVSGCNGQLVFRKYYINLRFNQNTNLCLPYHVYLPGLIQVQFFPENARRDILSPPYTASFYFGQIIVGIEVTVVVVGFVVDDLLPANLIPTAPLKEKRNLPPFLFDFLLFIVKVVLRITIRFFNTVLKIIGTPGESKNKYITRHFLMTNDTHANINHAFCCILHLCRQKCLDASLESLPSSFHPGNRCGNSNKYLSEFIGRLSGAKVNFWRCLKEVLPPYTDVKVWRDKLSPPYQVTAYFGQIIVGIDVTVVVVVGFTVTVLPLVSLIDSPPLNEKSILLSLFLDFLVLIFFFVFSVKICSVNSIIKITRALCKTQIKSITRHFLMINDISGRNFHLPVFKCCPIRLNFGFRLLYYHLR